MGLTQKLGTIPLAILTDASNNVGIGAAPSGSYKLEVTGTAKVSSTLLLGGDATISKSGDAGLNLNTTTTNGVAVTRYQTTAAGSLWGTGINITGADSRWEIYNFALGSSPFRLSSTGAATFSSSVSINTTNAYGKFQTKVATDSNFYLTNYNAGEVSVQFTNDANSLQCKAQFLASQFAFMGGGNVGIGVTPASVAGITELALGGSSSNPKISGIRDGADAFYIYSDSGGTDLYERRNLYLRFGTNNTERMRITSGGKVTINTPTAGTALFVNGLAGEWCGEFSNANSSGSFGININAGNSSGTYALNVTNYNGATLFFRILGNGRFSTGVGAESPYNLTTGTAANVTVGSDGNLNRFTSSLKYKTDVRNYDKGLAEVLQMRPVYYKGKNDGDTQFAGLIAEEIHELGLTEFVQYAVDKTPDALSYANMIALLTKAIQEQNEIITSLQERLNKAGL